MKHILKLRNIQKIWKFSKYLENSENIDFFLKILCFFFNLKIWKNWKILKNLKIWKFWKCWRKSQNRNSNFCYYIFPQFFLKENILGKILRTNYFNPCLISNTYFCDLSVTWDLTNVHTQIDYHIFKIMSFSNKLIFLKLLNSSIMFPK